MTWIIRLLGLGLMYFFSVASRADENYMNQIYSHASDHNGQTMDPLGLSIDVAPTLEIPVNFATRQKYYQIDFSSQLGPLAGFQSTLAAEGLHGSRLGLQLAYSQKQGVFDVVSQTGLRAKDAILIQLASASMVYHRPHPGSIFFTDGALGCSRLTQTGQLDGLSQSFVIPFIALGGGVYLIGREAMTSSPWQFAGMTFAVHYRKSFFQATDGLLTQVGASFAF